MPATKPFVSVLLGSSRILTEDPLLRKKGGEQEPHVSGGKHKTDLLGGQGNCSLGHSFSPLMRLGFWKDKLSSQAHKEDGLSFSEFAANTESN